MSPYPRPESLTAIGFPRVSGDEPNSKMLSLIVLVFSPRERG